MIDVTQAIFVLAGLSIGIAVILLVGSLAFFGLFVQREYPPDAVAVEEAEPPVDPALRARSRPGLAAAATLRSRLCRDQGRRSVDNELGGRGAQDA